MSKDAEYNEEQRAAIEAQESIAINAGPGTGKTKTLVGRYIELARRENYDFSRIVAITFTENAAIELRERISESIPQEMFLDFISNARIGTIHSFCDSIVRKHAPALGISPGFTILKENQPLISLVVDDLLNGESLEDLKLIGIFDNFRKDELKRLLRSFLLLRPMHVIKPLSYEEYVALSENALGNLVSKDLKALAWLLRSLPQTSYIDALLQEIKSYRSLDLRGKEAVVESVSEIERSALSNPSKMDRSALLRDRAGEIKVTRFLLRRMFPFPVPISPFLSHRTEKEMLKEINRAKNSTLKEITQVKNRIKKVCDDCHLEESDMEYEYRIYSVMSELFKVAEKRYQEAKKDIVDFDDMLLHTKKLLENRDIAELEGNRISYLLVDEFQDVDKVQYEIFRALLGSALKEKFTIVGDPKQAIYSFRGGEMSIFNEINREIETKSLNISYRSTPRLINFFNLVSKVSFCGNEYSPEHQELSTEMSSEPSTVSFDLVLENIKSESTDEDDAFGEMSLIIPRIAEMQKKGIEPGKMAILLDSRAELTELVDALTDARIPFEVVSGAGFFEVPEVKCMMALIDFLYDECDDSALFALLRSPMFGLSDRDIYEISLEQEKSLYKKLGLHNPEIYGELERCKTMVDRKNLSEIIEELICRTNYRGALAGSRRGSTAVNNAEKFISRLREMEGSGVRSIYAIREEIKGVASAREGEANVPQSNCIKVMTVHAAKGLEFDVVFIPYLYKSYNMRNENVVFHKGYMGLKMNVARFSPYTKDTIIRKWIIKEMRKIETEEKKRLLYVAMTRAKKHVVFTGKRRITDGEIKSEKAGKKQNTWGCEVLDPVFEKISDISLSQIALDEYLKNKNETHIDVLWDKDEIKGIGIVDRAIESFETPEINTPKMELVEKSVQQKVKIDPSAAGDIYECPAKYLISNVVGMRKDLSFIKSISLNRKPDGMFYGKVLHRALELGFCPSYEKIVREVAMEMHVKLDEKVMGRALREIDEAKELYDSSELKRIVDSADLVKREVKVYKSFSNFVIEGEIDLLLKIGDEVLIVDYKSENPRDIERSIAERSYDRQLQLYGLCIKKPKLAIYGIMDGRLRYIDVKDITTELENLSDRIIKREFEPDAQICEKCDLKYLCMWSGSG